MSSRTRASHTKAVFVVDNKWLENDNERAPAAANYIAFGRKLDVCYVLHDGQVKVYDYEIN